MAWHVQTKQKKKKKEKKKRKKKLLASETINEFSVSNVLNW